MQAPWSFVLLLSAVAAGVPPAGTVEPYRLRVEYAERPLGLDVPTPRFSWAVHAPGRAAVQTAFRVAVRSADGTMVADTGKVASSSRTTAPLTLHENATDSDFTWFVELWDANDKPSAPVFANFSTGLLGKWREPKAWGATWIGEMTKGRGNLFRKHLRLPFAPVRARLYLACPGYCRVLINGIALEGKKLGHQQVYERRILYDAFDVGSLLVEKSNAIGIEVGLGWYDFYETPRHNKKNYHGLGNRTVLAILTAKGAKEGESKKIVTTTAWSQHAGPVVADDIFIGETQDLRLAMPGWAEGDFDDSAWGSAEVVPQPGGVLESASVYPAIEVTDSYRPVGFSEPSRGIQVVDFGRVISGWSRLRVPGSTCAGCNITLVHGEMLLENGTVARLYRKAPMTQSYLLRGDGQDEDLETRFSSYGFRYIELHGWDGKASKLDFEARAIHTNVARAGAVAFEGPDAQLLATIQNATLASGLANLVSVPTDCPTRERRGYLGDSHLVADTMAANFHMPGVYTKFLMDVQHSQWQLNPDAPAALGCKAPWYHSGGENCDPSWTVGYASLVHLLLEEYNDTRVVAQHWDSLKAFHEFISETIEPDGLWKNYPGSFGDWNAVPWPLHDETSHHPSALIATFQYVLFCRNMADFSAVLGKGDDEAAFQQRASMSSSALHARFWNGTAYSVEGEKPSAGKLPPAQTVNALPLFLGATPPEKRAAAAASLVAAFRETDDHLIAGIVGTRYVLPALADHGALDLAVRLLTQTSQPSWGYWIGVGATTLWESWLGGADPATTPGSRNHIMFGSQSAFYYSHVVGLRRAARGWAAFTFAPPAAALSGLDGASAELETSAGRMAGAWHRAASNMTVEVSVPPSATARCAVPLDGRGAGEVQITEGGVLVWDGMRGFLRGTVAGVEAASADAAVVTLQLAHGNFAFLVQHASNQWI